MKKYEFTGKTIQYNGKTLKQIKRLSDGLVGGYIESESNLSQEGNAIVCGNAVVYENAVVCGNAVVYENAVVCGNAVVYENAVVCGNAKVCGKAKVCDNHELSGENEPAAEVKKATTQPSYEIITGTLTEIKAEVNTLVKLGYKPQGGLIATPKLDRYIQTLYKDI